jgi:hypothetical protein
MRAAGTTTSAKAVAVPHSTSRGVGGKAAGSSGSRDGVNRATRSAVSNTSGEEEMGGEKGGEKGGRREGRRATTVG